MWYIKNGDKYFKNLGFKTVNKTDYYLKINEEETIYIKLNSNKEVDYVAYQLYSNTISETQYGELNDALVLFRRYKLIDRAKINMIIRTLKNRITDQHHQEKHLYYKLMIDYGELLLKNIMTETPSKISNYSELFAFSEKIPVGLD